MKKLTFVFSILCAFAAPAFAGPCVALDYQEMKDMSINDLVKEACKANEAGKRSFDESVASPSLSKVSRDSMRDFEQCDAQTDRMLRVLKTRGVSGKLYELCAQQAAGQTIKAPAEVKQ